MPDKMQPRRPRPGLSASYPGLYQLGDPLRDGLTADLAEMKAAVRVATDLGEQLTLPDFDDEARALFSQDSYDQQAGTAFIIANILKDDGELRDETRVTTADLIDQMKKESQLLRLQAAMEQVQHDGADGKLMAGALFDFYEEKALSFFDRLNGKLPERERAALLGELGAIHALLRKDAQDRASKKAAGERSREELHTELAEKEGEVDYLRARKLVREGQPVDDATLAGARRYQELRTGGQPAMPAARTRERRKKPRDE